MELFGFDGIPLTWILAIGTLTLIYVYGKWRNRVFKDAGIPGPEPTIYIGNLLQMIRERAKGVDFDNPMAKKYGKVFGSFLGGIPFINVSDPDIAREILIKQFDNFTDRVSLDLSDYPIDKGILLEKGATWKRVRNIVSPTFSGAKLRLMCDKINECAKTLTNNFLKAAEKHTDIDIKDYFGAFTMDIISSTAFGIEMDSQNDTSNVFIREARRVFAESSILNPAFMIAMIFPGLAPLFKALGFSLFPKGPVQFLAKAITEMIEQRKNEPGTEKRLDFLQLLLDAEDDGIHDTTQSDQSKKGKKSKKMSHGEMLGQALLFFVAGYETTANTLHFAAYELATNTDVQQRLVEEVDTLLGEAASSSALGARVEAAAQYADGDESCVHTPLSQAPLPVHAPEVLGENAYKSSKEDVYSKDLKPLQREPDYDNISELTYLDHVITETLRMYPVVPALTRMTKDTVQIQGYTFPKDCAVVVPSLAIQRDPDIYPEPHQFNPDRWERKSDIDPMNYLSFGHGPRHCIGMRLAQVEMKIALAQVLKKITFVPAPNTPESLKSTDLKLTSLLGTAKNIFLRVKTR